MYMCMSVCVCVCVYIGIDLREDIQLPTQAPRRAPRSVDAEASWSSAEEENSDDELLYGLDEPAFAKVRDHPPTHTHTRTGGAQCILPEYTWRFLRGVAPLLSVIEPSLTHTHTHTHTHKQTNKQANVHAHDGNGLQAQQRASPWLHM